jgi:outer membrane protein assembly factor BamE
MKKIIILKLLATCIILSLVGCSQSQWLYRENIQQGNIITSELVQKMRVGMSKEAIRDILGPPLLIDTFNDNRWTYIYTLKTSKGKYIERHVVIYFKNNRANQIKVKNIPER